MELKRQGLALERIPSLNQQNNEEVECLRMTSTSAREVGGSKSDKDVSKNNLKKILQLMKGRSKCDAFIFWNKLC